MLVTSTNRVFGDKYARSFIHFIYVPLYILVITFQPLYICFTLYISIDMYIYIYTHTHTHTHRQRDFITFHPLHNCMCTNKFLYHIVLTYITLDSS